MLPARASAKNLVRFVGPEFRHSGGRRNPGILYLLDPGLRRGDDQRVQRLPDRILDNGYTKFLWGNPIMANLSTEFI